GRLVIMVSVALAIVSIRSHARAQGSGDQATPADPGTTDQGAGTAPDPGGEASGDSASQPGGEGTGASGETGASGATGETGGEASGATGETGAATGTELETSDMPVNLRLRRLEQRVQ